MTKVSSSIKEVVDIKEQPKLIISKELSAEINYLHYKFKKEWSGILFYSIVSGNIKEPSTLVLKAERVLLMDLGSEAYTEYEGGTDVLDFYEKYPDCENMRRGHIHTHHSMSIFFSGTDSSELHGNSDKYDYYLSLIVGFNMEYKAKIAISGNHKFEKSYKGGFKSGDIEIVLKSEEENTEKETILSMDCTIEIEASEEFKRRYSEIEEDKKKVVPYKPYNSYNNNYGGINQGGAKAKNYGNEYDDYYDEEWYASFNKGYQKKKPIKDVENPKQTSMFGKIRELGYKLVNGSNELDRVVVLKMLQRTLNFDVNKTLDVASCLAALSQVQKEQLDLTLDVIEDSFEKEIVNTLNAADLSQESVWKAVRAYNIAIDIIGEKRFDRYKNISDIRQLFAFSRKYYQGILEAKQEGIIHD